MKESTSSFWPRGLPAGALLAALLIVPAFVVMMFDATAGTARHGAPGRLAMFARAVPLRANSAFFDGRLAVQAVLSQRFAAVPLAKRVVQLTHERRDLAAASQAPEIAPAGLLRLRLENRSDQDIEVEIVRVDSALGDLVGRPDRLMLAPNEAASIDSPVPGDKITANSVPMAVALRLGGSLETKNLVLNERTLARAGN